MVFTEAARQINLQITGGSTAVRFTGRYGMRFAGAAARAMLVEAAADRWNVPAQRITIKEGIVSDPVSGRSAGFGELAEAASQLSVPRDPPLKDPVTWRLAGTSPLRADIPPKTNGTFEYGIDFQLPDMLHAAVRSAPVPGGRLLSVDPSPAKAMPGVVDVVATGRAVAVIAEGWWRARQALDALDPQFDDGGATIRGAAELIAAQDRALEDSDFDELFASGDVTEALASAQGKQVEAVYRTPWLHHGAMEPINVTAQFADGKLTVWAGEQDALGSKAQLMELSGLGAGEVEIHGLAAGGTFGRRVPPSADYMEHAVALARAASPRPVKLILHREEEFTQGAYRPALATSISAALGEDGLPIAWSQTFLVAPTRNEGFALLYRIPNQSLRSIAFATHLRTGTWRAVAHTQHAFWTESFIDELAHAAGRDPYEYRRALLAEGSREQRVLDAAAELGGWNDPLAPGMGRGIAIAESYGTIAAHVVEVVIEDGLPKVRRVSAAIDCGTVIHPDTARQQVEGAIVMGLSAALREEITLADGAVVEQGFNDYPIFTMADTPSIDIVFLKSDGPWGGLGEPGLPPAAPALANAVFAATGERHRTLPIVKRAET
jgi:isoquinoline 1-oxidoreductase beta subunit